jgi:PAS domain S-box-containing protein
MADRPLRRILFRQAVLIVLIPFILMTAVGILWLAPLVRGDLESRQRKLAEVIGSQLDVYLRSVEMTVKASASAIRHGVTDASGKTGFLDSQVRASDFLSALYVTGPDGSVTAIGLPLEREALHADFLKIDLSGNKHLLQAREKGASLWSDTFLSIVSGGMSVLCAVPFEGGAVAGEVRLERLERFLRNISGNNELFIFVLDRRGQVIADSKGRYTAQQHNLGHLPLVRGALLSRTPATGPLSLEGRRMIGSVVRIPSVNWHVLAAQPVALAYRSAWAIAGTAVLGIVFAGLISLAASIYLSRRLASQFEVLAGQARSLSLGKEASERPQGAILEFNQLADAMNRMAADLHERERELRHAKEYTENLIQAANVIIMCLDENGMLTFCNRMAEKVIGYSLDELKGMNWFENILPPDASFPVRAEFDRLMESGYDGTFENDIVTRTGERRTIAWRNCPIVYGGLHTGILSFGIDVTEHRKADEKLRQAARLESVGRLAGGVAHDFNNMLCVILGFTELSLNRSAQDETLRQYLGEIRKAAEHSRDVTSQLLAFARQDMAFPRAVDLNAAIAETGKTLELLMGEDTRVIFRTAPDLWKTSIDPSQVNRILVNLAMNARDAMTEGGVLVIETANAEIDAEFRSRHPEASPGRYVKLSVSDNGTGMDQETLCHIFEPFYTTKEVGKGTGLGLATVYGIVSQNGGLIVVQSEPGRGTSFELYFPRAEDVREESPVAVDPVHRGALSVLLVEDNEMVLRMVKRILDDAGFSVVETPDPEEAILLFSDRGVDFDLVITDVVMPKMSGREMMEKIGALKPGIKVLYMSGYAADSIHMRGLDEKGTHFIQKPFDINRFRKKIAEIAAGS